MKKIITEIEGLMHRKVPIKHWKIVNIFLIVCDMVVVNLSIYLVTFWRIIRDLTPVLRADSI